MELPGLLISSNTVPNRAAAGAKSGEMQLFRAAPSPNQAAAINRLTSPE